MKFIHAEQNEREAAKRREAEMGELREALQLQQMQRMRQTMPLELR